MNAPLRMDDGQQTLVLAPTEGLPVLAYWGPSLPLTEDLAQFALSAQSDMTGGMLDRLAPLTLCPVADGVFQGQPALELADAEGRPLSPRFGAAAISLADSAFVVEAVDAALGLTYRARIALAGGVVELSSALVSARPVRLRWLAAPVVQVPAGLSDLIEFSGKWTAELHASRQSFSPGARLREARGGRSGQEVPPFAILAEPGTTNTRGQAMSLAYGWPAGHRMIAEELPCGRRQIQFGHVAGSEPVGTEFASATLTAARSDAGLNGCAVKMQAHVRDRLVPWPDAARPRPVHYNCWEAVYLQHDLATLSDMARRAARIGAERFVLDDGWFGRRDNDRSSLGDWTVDAVKWPHGLQPLIDVVKAEGMTFGLWFEPEMVNPDSDLYRAHPEWALGAPDQVTGRHQFVLDLSQAVVRDYLFAKVSAILGAYDIDYVKWDHNRLVPVLDAAQGRGVLDLMARLRQAHPRVEIESCASGGGRIDYGILTQTCRVWLSDCIDAVERLRMQHTAALFLPSAITGSHVGAFRSHTTGRSLPMSFRAWTAAARHMGFEMDLRDLTAEEAEVLTRVTAWYKANRGWMMGGAIHLLDAEDPAVTAEIQIAADGHRFVSFVGQGAMSRQILPLPLRLTGLEPQALYRVRLRNPEDVPPQSRGPNALKSGPVTLSGQALMNRGLMLPVAWPATVWVVEGERL
ncbi:alpha-galactosidase [bacterium]|nr:alpha-galactosidase [bacterium]